ncbi:uncharacterized protein LOC122945737 [Bufo gargarizans]|uniref:uncharacterized protein LOC122945737 n=1 Tax=Bufo gargarizans TaxID=30331 RepID=UPI001CF1C5F4|nr:uncharacterized protein LOC122945737 [Bufo gargarizans]
MAGFLAAGICSDKWDEEARVVFSEADLPPTNRALSITGSFKLLTKIYKDQVRGWWEIQTLETYIQHQIVPRGMRIPFLPSNRIQSPEFRKKWEKEAVESSLRLMALLLEEEKALHTKNTTLLQEQIAEVSKFSSNSEFTRKEVFLQQTVERFTAQLKERKHSQFLRDKADFKEGRILDFATKTARTLEVETEPSSSEGETELEGTSYQNSQYPIFQPSNKGSRGRGGRGRNPRSRGGFLGNQTTRSYSLRNSKNQ